MADKPVSPNAPAPRRRRFGIVLAVLVLLLAGIGLWLLIDADLLGGPAAPPPATAGADDAPATAGAPTVGPATLPAPPPASPDANLPAPGLAANTPDTRGAGEPDGHAPPGLGPFAGMGAGDDPVDPDDPANRQTGVRGTVVDADGVPVIGATVSLRGNKPGANRSSFSFSSGGGMRVVTPGETRSRSSVTADTGEFEVLGLDAAYRYTIVVKPPEGLLRAEKPAPALKQGEVVDAGDVTVNRPASIAGIVLDPNGLPVADARVRLGDGNGPFDLGDLLEDDDDGEADGSSVTRGMTVFRSGGAAGDGGDMVGPPITMFSGRGVRTDKDGRFTLTKVKPGEHTITAKKHGFRSAKLAGVTVRDGEQKTGVILRLGAGLTLTVVVRDANGNAIAGAKVAADAGFGRGLARPVLSSVQGEATLTGLGSTEITLTVRAEGYAPFLKQLKLDAEAENRREVVLRPGATVTGRLVNKKTGAGLAGGWLWLNPTDGEAGLQMSMGGESNQTDAEGRFELKGVAPGTYRLSARVPGHAETSVPLTVAPEQETVDAGTIEVSALGSVVVTVVDTEGKPIEGASVEAGDLASRGVVLEAIVGDGDEGTMRFMPSGGGTRTDAEGKATLSGLEPGSADLRARKSGLADGFAQRVTVPEGGTPGTARITLTSGSTITGSALTVEGKPFAGAVLTLTRRDNNATWSASTDAAGQFNFAHVPAGAYRLSLGPGSLGFGGPGRAPEYDWFALADGQTVTRTVRDTPKASLAGVVRDASGQSVAGAQLTFGYLDSWRPGDPEVAWGGRRTKTDAAGRYSFEKLTPGSGYGVTIQTPGRKVSFAVPLGEARAYARDFTLPALTAGTTVHAAVWDPTANAPITGATVRLTASGDGPTFRRERQSGADGTVEFTGVPPGRYELRATAPGFAALPRPLVVGAAPVEAPRLELGAAGALVIQVELPGAPAGVEARVIVSPLGLKSDSPQEAPVDARFVTATPGTPERIGGLLIGQTYRLTISAPGYAETTRTAICEGSTPAPLVVTLTPQ